MIERTAKIVGIIVAIVGCLIGILNFFKSSADPAQENAKLHELMLGTWYWAQFGESYDLERLDVSENYTYRRTDRRYAGPVEKAHFSCESTISGKWSIKGRILTMQSQQILSGPQAFGAAGALTPEKAASYGFRCTDPSVGYTAQYRIDAISKTELEVTSTYADQKGRYVTSVLTRTPPTLGTFRRMRLWFISWWPF